MSAKILIVDDEPYVREILDRVLRTGGHEVRVVDGAASAVAALEASSFDVMLTDVVMPGMDGFGLLRRAKSLRPELRVIVLTGHARSQSISDFLLYGADEFLAKPFQVDELLATVERVTRPATAH
jgi:DNA-binding NtrC family response regulator